jgi:ribonuclease BN (tRNA processing enzyme)
MGRVSSRLVVLGSCGAWPEAGRACSGFVLEHDGFRIVLDLGYATLPRLLAHLGSSVGDGVDAVVITHRHPDHAIDLHGLFRARWFGRRDATAIPLYAPRDVLDLMVHLEDGEEADVRQVFDWHPLPGDAYDVGPFRLESWDLPHWVTDAGVRLTAPGLVVAYTGDTGPDPALADLGRDADLYVMEASDRDQQPGTPQATTGRALHLSAREAGRAAAAAGARRLLLMHFWPGNDREASRRAAAAEFGGEVLVAEEGAVISLP